MAAAPGMRSALTIKRSNFMQTGVSHVDPVTADMKRSSNKHKVCFSYSFVYCLLHLFVFSELIIFPQIRDCGFYRLIINYTVIPFLSDSAPARKDRLMKRAGSSLVRYPNFFLNVI